MALLLARLHFTEKLDAALAAGGDLAAIKSEIQSKRTAAIVSLRGTMTAALRRQSENLQILLKEQLDVLGDMMAGDAAAAAAVWKQEMRFYPQPDGSVICKCCDYQIPVADNFPGNHILVTTPITRQVRRKVFEAAATGKIFMAVGPAGVGKTETVKDWARMLGMEAPVINCSSSVSELPHGVLEMAEQHGGRCPVVFDEVNRCSEEVIIKVVKETTAKTLTCLTWNPGYGGAPPPPSIIQENSIEHHLTVPDFDFMMQAMLGNAGIIEADSLGVKLASVVLACKEKCSKQRWYDFGMRFLKSALAVTGKFGRKHGFDDETKLVVDALCFLLYGRLKAEDWEVAMNEITKAFGIDAAIPAGRKLETIEGVVKTVEEMTQVRHGICVIGSVNVDATIAAIDAATKSESIVVDGATEALYGPDGFFTKAFKAAMSKGTAINIYVKTPLDAAALEPLNTVLDDNKLLTLVNGERLPLTPHMRIIIFEKDCSDYPPAAVSRMGCVWAGAASA